MFFGIVKAVAVGGLGDEVIALWECFRTLNNPVVRPANVAGVSQVNFLAVFDYFQVNNSASQHMPGVCKFHIYFVVDVKAAVVIHGDKQFQSLFSILYVVDWIYRWKILSCPFFVKPFGISFLNMSAVGEHDGAEVTGSSGANHRTTEPKFVEVGNKSRVIDMSV